VIRESACSWPGPEISVVVPLFDEAENLPELYRRLVSALPAADVHFELLFIDDGSRDETPRLLAELHHQDARVTVVTLSRNFGHQAALSAGIEQARGDAVVLMDGDLQDPPEVLPRFITAWRLGNDVVYAIRGQRKESLLLRSCYALFYRVLQAVSDLNIPVDSGDFCLMDRRVVEALKQLPERGRFVRGLRAFVGFRQTGLAYERAARQAGKPKYTFRALCRLAFDGLIGFSSAPLRSLFYAAALCFSMTFGGGVALILQTEPAQAWWITTLAVIGCTGLQLFGMGILGEYIRRIFQETKGRPTYIVADIHSAKARVRERAEVA
jgi:dolichol-phosphate mannosyltransferase